MAERVLKDEIAIPDNKQGKKVVRSILTFDTDTGKEELFLLYSLGRENGPGIKRDGKHSPWMPHPEHLAQKTTDPDILRYGTSFINSELQKSELKKLKKRTMKEKKEGNNNELVEELKELYESNQQQKNYIDLFKKEYSEYEIVGVQGLGDLTMNLWNVAFINDRITKEPKLLHLFDEPIHDRVYTCLVKWKEQRKNRPRLEIKNVRFNRYLYNVDKNAPGVVVVVDKKEEDVADQVEFVVFGQQVIRPKHDDPENSEIFHPREIVHQFADMRHIFQLPNLNPDDNRRPRYFFGRQQWDDIWFAEAELLDSRNLRKAAIADSVELSTLYSGLGVSEEQLKEALMNSSYSMTESINRPLYYDKIEADRDTPPKQSDKAEWRFVPEDRTLVEIRLRENRYPCTLVGLDSNGKLYFLAWSGIYSKKPGWTIRQSANALFTRNVRSAILCDEGGDVFQYFKKEGQELKPIIRPNRGQVRALFIVARKRKHG